MKRKLKNDYTEAGMTSAEMLVASSISVIVLAGILMLTQFSQYMWKNERVKSDLIGKLAVTAERMQKEIGLTDGRQIFYYPQDSVTYSAISFPAAIPDTNGFLQISGTDPKIVWNQTVIYHTYAAGEKVELRRTVFSPRNADMPAADRQTQLTDVVTSGHPTIASGGAGYEPYFGTRVICDSEDIVLTIKPTNEFDGYSPTVARSENVNFGSIRLDPGDHYITFTVTGKNSLSTGYRLGMDSFSITPSGCAQEAEEAEVGTHTAGIAHVPESMTTYGSWSGNWQLEYQATAPTNYLNLNFYYDKWIETNFAACSLSYTLRNEYSNRTGDEDGIVGASANDYDYVVRLGGYGDSWSAGTQVGVSAASEIFSTGVNFRNVIKRKYIDVEGAAIKIKFDNTKDTDSGMAIDSAWIMTRSSGPDGTAPKQVTFGAGAYTLPIAAGGIGYSDWIDIGDFDKSKDYLLAFHVSLTGEHDITRWLAPVADTQDDNSYYFVGEAESPLTPWADRVGIDVTATDNLYAVDSIKASYFSNGTLTSQVYDTGMAAPSYSTLTWNIARDNYGSHDEPRGLGANVKIKVRSNNSADALKATTDWTGATEINTLSAESGSESIAVTSTGTGRYCQFRADFDSHPSTSTSFDYTKSCVLKNLSISWPGQQRIVDVSGYFTRRPNYGIFSVKVDSQALIKGLEVKLQIADKAVGGGRITKYLTLEAQPRNTGR